MSRVLEAEAGPCMGPSCLLGTSEGSIKGSAAQAGTGERTLHGISGGFLNIAGVMVGLGIGTWTSFFPPPKALSVNSLLRHTRASSVSPLTHTNGSRSTQLLWWLPTRASAARRPRLIYMQWQITPTTTCFAVRATSLSIPQLRVASG